MRPVISLGLTLIASACAAHRPLTTAAEAAQPSMLLPNGNEWMTDNLNVDVRGSYCYENVELNCRRYGRLYTWASAGQACQLLGNGWRLPTDDEWRNLAKHYGGVGDDSGDNGRAAYAALVAGGRSGFNAGLGGGRDLDADRYARLEAHGFYWTSSEADTGSAVFYNFAKGGLSLYRQPDGEKLRAFSVRCVRR
jgi:uncharacterized protein (TIGR02145 family)